MFSKLKKIKADEYCCNAAVLSIFSSSICYLISLSPIEFISTSSKIIRLILLLMCILNFIIYLKRVNKINKVNVLIIGILIILFCVSLLNNNNFNFLINKKLWIDIFVKGLFTMILVSYTKDAKLFLKKLVLYSKIILLMGITLIIISRVTNYMAFGYVLLFATITILYYGFYNKKKTDVLLGFIGVILIFIRGSRGAFLISIISIPLYFMLLCDNKSIKKKFTILFVLTLLTTILFSNYIINGIIDVVDKMNIYSRTIKKLANNTIFSLSHRDENITYGIALLTENNKNLFLGLGMAGERYHFIKNLSYLKESGYPHNIFLELLLHYGIILGIIFILLILYAIKLTFNKKLDKEYKIISVAIFTYNLQLLISSSYLQSIIFFAFIGWTIVCKNRIRGVRNENIRE